MHDISDRSTVVITPRRRARRSTAEIRALILEAARAVFAERGFAGATTRHIAARAEVDRLRDQVENEATALAACLDRALENGR